MKWCRHLATHSQGPGPTVKKSTTFLDTSEQVTNHGYTTRSLKLSKLPMSINIRHESLKNFSTISWSVILIVSWDMSDVSDRVLVEVILTRDKHTAVCEGKSENITRQNRYAPRALACSMISLHLRQRMRLSQNSHDYLTHCLWVSEATLSGTYFHNKCEVQCVIQ
jgi:hypothetical protein